MKKKVPATDGAADFEAAAAAHIGDMSQTERILLGLGLPATSEQTPPPTPNR